jgi:hypothetical protein
LEQSRKQDKRNLFFLSVWKMQEEVKWLKASLNKYAGTFIVVVLAIGSV